MEFANKNGSIFHFNFSKNMKKSDLRAQISKSSNEKFLPIGSKNEVFDHFHPHFTFCCTIPSIRPKFIKNEKAPKVAVSPTIFKMQNVNLNQY